MSRLYFEILTENQKIILESLRAFSKYGILGGGTGLAIQINHRKSYDFDIFCPTLLSKNLIFKIKEHFGKTFFKSALLF